MPKRQLVALCACNIVMVAGLAAFIGLMPVYLNRLGADSSAIGFFLAFGYLSLAIGAVVGGRLSDRLQRRKLLVIVAGALTVPITLLAGQVTAMLPLMLVMAALWLMTGIVMTAINILAGLFSEPGERGRLFGVINLTLGLGSVLGSGFNGPIVDRWGFPALFGAMSVVYLATPLIALALMQDKRVPPSDVRAASSGLGGAFASRTFLFLFIASVIAEAANGFIFLSRATAMDRLRFDATSIAGVSAVAGLVTLPLPLLIGYLTDRGGRRALLYFCFVTTTLGLLILFVATEWWQFCLATVLQTILAMSLVVGSALVTDSFPADRLGTPLALLNATPWIGIVLGLGGGGVVINSLPMAQALGVGTVVSVIALILLLPVAPQKAVVFPDESLAPGD